MREWTYQATFDLLIIIAVGCFGLAVVGLRGNIEDHIQHHHPELQELDNPVQPKGEE